MILTDVRGLYFVVIAEDPTIDSIPSTVVHNSQIRAAKIPPTTRKRKAAEATITSTNIDDLPNKRVLASAAKPTSALAGSVTVTAAAPPTPLTTGSNDMDSDEDYISGLSSEDELMQDDSLDAMSGAEG